MSNDSGATDNSGPSEAGPTDTGQISVAELLARNGQQASTREGGRRRGRPGGISVAELTGDLPVLRETDTGSIHAVVPPAETPVAPAIASVETPNASVAEPAQAPPEAPPSPAKRRRPEIEIHPPESSEQAWSSAREPELLSGGTVAGELLRNRAENVQAVPPEPESTVVTEPAPPEPVVDRSARKAEAKAAKLAAKAAKSASKTDAEPSAARQWLVLGAQAVVAIVAGALLFKGFEQLWVSMQWVALALAVVVIVGLVAVVRILRKTDDLFSIVIAIAVGLFVTLGPLVFVLTTGRG